MDNDQQETEETDSDYSSESEEELLYFLDKFENVLLGFLKEFLTTKQIKKNNIEGQSPCPLGPFGDGEKHPTVYNLNRKIQLLRHLNKKFELRIQTQIEHEILRMLFKIANGDDSKILKDQAIKEAQDYIISYKLSSQLQLGVKFTRNRNPVKTRICSLSQFINKFVEKFCIIYSFEMNKRKDYLGIKTLKSGDLLKEEKNKEEEDLLKVLEYVHKTTPANTAKADNIEIKIAENSSKNSKIEKRKMRKSEILRQFYDNKRESRSLTPRVVPANHYKMVLNEIFRETSSISNGRIRGGEGKVTSFGFSPNNSSPRSVYKENPVQNLQILSPRFPLPPPPTSSFLNNQDDEEEEKEKEPPPHKLISCYSTPRCFQKDNKINTKNILSANNSPRKIKDEEEEEESKILFLKNIKDELTLENISIENMGDEGDCDCISQKNSHQKLLIEENNLNNGGGEGDFCELNQTKTDKKLTNLKQKDSHKNGIFFSKEKNSNSNFNLKKRNQCSNVSVRQEEDSLKEISNKNKKLSKSNQKVTKEGEKSKVVTNPNNSSSFLLGEPNKKRNEKLTLPNILPEKSNEKKQILDDNVEGKIDNNRIGLLLHNIFSNQNEFLNVKWPKGQCIYEQYYSNNKIFTSIYENEGGRINYPDGFPALLISAPSPDVNMIVIRNKDQIDQYRRDIIGAFSTAGKGIIYGPQGNILLEYEDTKLIKWEQDQEKKHTFSWNVMKPMLFKLNNFISCQISGQKRINLIFRGDKRGIRLNMGKGTYSEFFNGVPHKSQNGLNCIENSKHEEFIEKISHELKRNN